MIRCYGQGGVKIWATTPVHIPNPPYNDGNCAHITFGNGFQAAYTLGWRMLDRYGITAALKTSLEGMGISFQAAAMRDETHAWPFVQNEITNVLLNELCPYPTNSCRTNKPVPGRA